MTEISAYAKRKLLEALAEEDDSYTYTQEIGKIAKYDWDAPVSFQADGYAVHHGIITDIVVLGFPELPAGDISVGYEIESSGKTWIVPEKFVRAQP